MSPILRAIRSWWLVALLSAGCTSYQKTSLTDIQSHPEQLVHKDVRVHYDSSDSTRVTGRSARERYGTEKEFVPDSVVALRVVSIKYPVLTGRTFSDSKTPAVPLQLNVEESRKVEVRGFSSKRLLVGAGAVALLFAATYGAAQSFELGQMFSFPTDFPYGDNPPPVQNPPSRRRGGKP